MNPILRTSLQLLYLTKLFKLQTDLPFISYYAYILSIVNVTIGTGSSCCLQVCNFPALVLFCNHKYGLCEQIWFKCKRTLKWLFPCYISYKLDFYVNFTQESTSSTMGNILISFLAGRLSYHSANFYSNNQKTALMLIKLLKRRFHMWILWRNLSHEVSNYLDACGDLTIVHVN